VGRCTLRIAPDLAIRSEQIWIEYKAKGKRCVKRLPFATGIWQSPRSFQVWRV
jgi:hypothetical protein